MKNYILHNGEYYMKLFSEAMYKSMREQTKKKLPLMTKVIFERAKNKSLSGQGENNMTFNEYQKECRETDVGTSAQGLISPGWLYYVLGLPDETGELCGKIKKLFRDHKGVVDNEFKERVTKECGDILWYMARLLDCFDIKFSDVAEENITKLLGRLERDTLHGDGDER
jgi:NTP pyrophosphatase (non-canonical NTP hydrolase)